MLSRGTNAVASGASELTAPSAASISTFPIVWAGSKPRGVRARSRWRRSIASTSRSSPAPDPQRGWERIADDVLAWAESQAGEVA
jgi:hypothetical protein